MAHNIAVAYSEVKYNRTVRRSSSSHKHGRGKVNKFLCREYRRKARQLAKRDLREAL